MVQDKSILKDVLRDGAFKGDVFFNEPMRRHTTLRIGGPADLFVVPEEETALAEVLRRMKAEGVPVMPVGGGSNLLVTDGGMEGAVFSLASLNRIAVVREDNHGASISVEAGAPLQKLIRLSRERGYKGIEGLAGIPGSVGGALRGNAGSFGCEIGPVVEAVNVLAGEGERRTIGREDLCFGYRSSDIPEGDIILGAVVRLEKDEPRDVSMRIDAALHEKKARQPLSEWSAGCVFRNREGVSAGRLIDEAGCKGMRRGDIEVSSLHANFFVNRGKGTASDFLALMDEVKERVLKVFGVELEPEIRIVGRR